MLTELGLYKLWGEDPERVWRFARPFTSPLVRLLAPGFGYGRERVPRAGGVVLAFNHMSAIDPPLVGGYTKRAIYYMAKAELLEVPVAGEILRWLGTFGVKRGEGDRDSLRVARWVVHEGHALGMFMEGTRQKHGHPGPAHPGAAMIAIQEEVPLVPCGLDTFGWSLGNRRRCAVVWGHPLDLGGLPKAGRGYKEGARIVQEEVVRLWRLAAGAVAADFPEELPDGAKRHGHAGRGGAIVVQGVEPWPDEPWAAGPLGPVYPGR